MSKSYFVYTNHIGVDENGNQICKEILEATGLSHEEAYTMWSDIHHTIVEMELPEQVTVGNLEEESDRYVAKRLGLID